MLLGQGLNATAGSYQWLCKIMAKAAKGQHLAAPEWEGLTPRFPMSISSCPRLRWHLMVTLHQGELTPLTHPTKPNLQGLCRVNFMVDRPPNQFILPLLGLLLIIEMVCVCGMYLSRQFIIKAAKLTFNCNRSSSV